MPSTPSTDELDNNDTLLNRRSSSGGLLSPEVPLFIYYYTNRYEAFQNKLLPYRSFDYITGSLGTRLSNTTE